MNGFVDATEFGNCLGEFRRGSPIWSILMIEVACTTPSLREPAKRNKSSQCCAMKFGLIDGTGRFGGMVEQVYRGRKPKASPLWQCLSHHFDEYRYSAASARLANSHNGQARMPASSPSIVYARFRFLAAFLGESRVVGIPLGAAAVVGGRIVCIERGARAKAIRQVRIC
jgi:hypothetical protein